MYEQKKPNSESFIEAKQDKPLNFSAEKNKDTDPEGEQFSGDNDFDNDDDLEEQENNFNEEEVAVIKNPNGSTNVGNIDNTAPESAEEHGKNN